MRATIVSTLAFFLSLAALAGAEPLVHVIAKGETIYAIAQEYKVSPEAILKANGIGDPTRIKVGQSLSIPRYHTVGKGETLFSISRLYGISVDELKAANTLDGKGIIIVGQALALPSKAKFLPASTTAALPAPQPIPLVPKPPVAKVTEGTDAAFPPLVKTSLKTVDASLNWPCAGEARYLGGKIEGIMILTERGMSAKAVAGGNVVSAGPYRGFGQVVFVQSKTGYIYVYAGNDSLTVGMGDSIKVGQEVGHVGFDAKEGRAAAYFFVFRNGESLDPARAPRG